MIINFIRGFLMSLADSVPGVSGGTIAFLLGFYDEFITSLNDLIGKDNKKRIKGLKFLLKLGIGWIIGFVLAIIILSSVFEKNIYIVSSLFLGFVIVALYIVLSEEIKELVKKKWQIIYMFVGIAIVLFLSFIKPTSEITDLTTLTPLMIVYIFICGAIAISAMILPGISGSSLLLIFGLYVPMVNAVKDVIHLNFSSLPAVIIFALGILFGIISVIKIIKLCITKYRSATVYLILGLMIGSLYAIVLGPTTLKTPLKPLSIDTFNIIAFIIGGFVIILLHQMAKISKRNKNEK